MRLGLIGTGAIGSALVEGLIGHAGWPGPVSITRRSEARSLALAEHFANVTIADPDMIARDSDIVIVAVRPEQMPAICQGMPPRPDQCVVSLAAGVDLPQLRQWLGRTRTIVRANPLPPVAKGLGPILVCPKQANVEQILAQVGEVVSFDEESLFHTFACAGALMAMYFEITATPARWLAENGAPSLEGARYMTSLFHALSCEAKTFDAAALAKESEACLTPGGLNEQVLRNLQDAGWFATIEKEMSVIHQRLTKS